MMASTPIPEDRSNAGSTYSNIRRSLRPLPQTPNASNTPAKPSTFRHQRNQTFDDSQTWKENRPSTPENRTVHRKESAPLSPEKSFNAQTSPQTASPQRLSPGKGSPRGQTTQMRPHSRSLQNANSPVTTAFSGPELETFQKSSTGHLRTLSKFAQSGEGDEFALDKATPSVVGMMGRRQLKRTDSVAANDKGRPRPKMASEWAAGNWMDKQRQFLQAYEYLCHIGEAKEWIEEVIQREIPPIVQMEEALRDGVTLAEVVQALYPDRPFRIFRHPKLQYRHSDNIALFFRLLDEVELPELFRFELIDLYEKKNTPKVIHCIHALSWLLFKKGLVDFRMGNLVGQLEFEHHELEQMQKGLDKAGVSMPSFAGMAANFGAEPEPEPEPEPESEEDRTERELHENENSISDFQAQIKGAMLRIKLGNVMNQLWDFETLLVEMQSRLRGDWARQIIQYRLSMRRFAVNLQASCRGFIVRSREQNDKAWRQAQEYDVLQLQSLIRGAKSRAQVNHLQSRLGKEDPGVKRIQAALRGALQRNVVSNLYNNTRKSGVHVEMLQAAIKGALARKHIDDLLDDIKLAENPLKLLQSAARGMAARASTENVKSLLHQQIPSITLLQASVRGAAARNDRLHLLEALAQTRNECIALQAMTRGAALRRHQLSDQKELEEQAPSILNLQSSIRGAILRNELKADVNALHQQEHEIVNLQALARAAVVRMQVGRTLEQLYDAEDDTVNLQALARAMIVRVKVDHMLTALEAEEDIVVDIQARLRGIAVRNKFEEKRRHYRENMDKVIKAQSFVRGKIQGEAYKSLTSGKNPPVNTVKGFVHLLNDSDFDFDEEIEFERTRKLVVQQVRQNEMAEQYISQLDIKIALLVKNKITLDEVVKHQKHFGGHIGNLLPNAEISSKDPFDLKALNKTSRKKLEHYQVFFFLLQTQSQYLARLFRRLREVNTAEKEYERIRHLMMGLFGYSQKRREEYYLIKLLARSAKEEIDSYESLPEYLRCNSFWSKLFASYVKSPRDRKFMRDVLGPIVREHVFDNAGLDLESDPMQIYRSAINNEELSTGRRSRRDPNIPREEAIKDPETRATFIQHLQDLRDIADQFFSIFEELIYRMPFGIRYIAQQMYECLLARFSGEDPGYVLQTVGHWVWRNYFQPAVIEPERHGVIDRGMTQEQKRNLLEIAKVVAQVVSGRLFGAENVYLQPLNSYIGESIQRLGHIWGSSEYSML